MEYPKKEELINAITDAARKAFLSLFENRPGNYYYCSLITTGEAHAPLVSAWSIEALDAKVLEFQNPQEARKRLKWSYADSPYYGYGESYFETVKYLFAKRPQISAKLSDDEWKAEYQIRIDAMEAAMTLLDSEGLFGEGNERCHTAVLVEVMPPDYTNTQRAFRLNPSAAIKQWLEEAAELE